jgi:hypothetical protein
MIVKIIWLEIANIHVIISLIRIIRFEDNSRTEEEKEFQLINGT